MKGESFHPPKWAVRFLQVICPEHLYEEIEGDLLQRFNQDLIKIGGKKSKRRFVWNAIRFFRPGIVFRNRVSLELNQPYMLRNYIKIMLRTMMKRKVYSTINILGLTVGISFALLTGVFIFGELQANKQLADVERLYILESNNLESSSGIPFFVPSPIARLIKEEYPSLVENYYRCNDRSITVSKGDKHFRVQSIIGDSTFLSMFGFPLLYGDPQSALTHPRSILITKKIALQYFGKADVVGDYLTLATEKEGSQEYKITAVLMDWEQNTVLNLMDMGAQIILPIQSLKDFNAFDPEEWTGAQMISYIKLARSASQHDLKATFNKIMTTHAPVAVKDRLKIEYSGLDEYYLTINNGVVRKLVITLATIGIFILLLAIVNFINITIGSSATRLKEIGIRKAIGGMRKQVVFQFLSESLLITFIATFLSLFVYELLRSHIGEILNTGFPSVINIPLSFWRILLAITVATGLLAGAYPALFLSSYKAIESLKGKLKSLSNTGTFSKTLISVQFLLAICVFIFSIVITRQVSYFLGKDLGYDKSSVLTVTSVPRIWSEEGLNQMEAAKEKFLQLSQVDAVSLSWDIPNGNVGISAEFYREGKQSDQAVGMPVLMTDEDYDETFGITVVDGVFFQQNGKSQADHIVINESAQKALDVRVGDKIKMKGMVASYEVAGVVKDFNFFSLHQKIKPVVFFHTRNNLTLAFRFFSFKLHPGNLSESVDALQAKWKEVFPNDPFEYAFMDQYLERLYKTELKLKKASGVATVLMLGIVLLGVFGLVSISVAKRTKEIGIRKVLGASVSNVLMLISKDFVWLIVGAFILAVPLSYHFINQWLSAFAYHVKIQWWMFAGPGVLVFTVALMVIAGQSMHAAMSNPTEALRNE